MDGVFHVVLVHPEIPQNTGNVIRLAANAGATLHLVEPLGFPLDSARMRRAGLDYREFADLRVHRDWPAAVAALDGARTFVVETDGATPLHEVALRAGDAFVFGSESAGLPAAVRDAVPAARHLHLPMRPGNRSLNLSNAVAVTVFEGWRQAGFGGAAHRLPGKTSASTPSGGAGASNFP
jgi:tRNA (cytidine/uridine-2'-O-)-methyltransferase